MRHYRNGAFSGYCRNSEHPESRCKGRVFEFRLGRKHVDVLEAAQHQAVAQESAGLTGVIPHGDLYQENLVTQASKTAAPIRSVWMMRAGFLGMPMDRVIQ